MFHCPAAIIQSLFTKRVLTYYHDTGLATYSKATGVIRHENELARKEKRGSCGGKEEGENDADGSLNNAIGVVGCLRDAGNNVARAAYNSLRIMCTTRRWGSAKVTLPAGCLLLSHKEGFAAHNEIGEEERPVCVYAPRTRMQYATLAAPA